MVRAANTGVSGVIDEFGSPYDRVGGGSQPRLILDPETGDYAIRGSIPAVVRVPSNGGITFYARFGDWFPMALSALVVGAICLHLVKRKLAAKAAI